MRQGCEAGRMERREQKSDRDPHRLADVVMLHLLPVLGQAVGLFEDDNEVRRILDVRLMPVGAELAERREPLGAHAPSKLLLSSSSAATRIFRFKTGSETTTNVHGC